MWMLASGALLPQRGAIFPALQSKGLSEQAIRRSWVRFCKGVWQTTVVLRLWQGYITAQESTNNLGDFLFVTISRPDSK
jgi:hypothetical protein